MGGRPAAAEAGAGAGAPLAAVAPQRGLRVQRTDYGAAWAALKQGLDRAFGRNPGDQRELIVQLNRLVYSICTCPCYNVPGAAAEGESPQPQRLFLAVHGVLGAQAATLARSCGLTDWMQENANCRSLTTGRPLLAYYREAWERYKRGLGFASGATVYLSTVGVQPQIQQPALREELLRAGGGVLPPPDVHTAGLVIWNQRTLQPMAKHVVTALLLEVECERRGQPADRSALQEVLASFRDVSVGDGRGGDHRRKGRACIAEWFEPRFLRQAEVYYRKDAAAQLAGGAQRALAGYMRAVEDIIARELARARECIDHHTERQLFKTLVKVLIEEQAAAMLAPFPQWLREGRGEEQRLLFMLLRRVEGGLGPMRKALEDHIDAVGKGTVRPLASRECRGGSLPRDYARALQGVADRFAEMVRERFDDHAEMRLALRVGCQRCVNRNALSLQSGRQSAQLLAHHAHELVGHAGEPPDADAEATLAALVGLLKHLDMKDVFQGEYATLLAQRLIRRPVAEADETRVARALGEVCGHDFAHRLTRMVGDSQNSRELTQAFSEHLSSRAPPFPSGLEMVVHVGTSGTWPLPRVCRDGAVRLPEPLAICRDIFTRYYQEVHCAGGRLRKLLWHHDQGSVVAVTRYALPKAARYELRLTVSQAAVLWCFADHSIAVLPRATVAARTGLEPECLDAAVQDLCKAGLLRAGPEETLAINLQFAWRDSTVDLIPDPGVNPCGERHEPEAAESSDDRRFAVQAALVRVLKARGRATHADLVEGVAKAFAGRWAVVPREVKRNVERLMDREIVQRAEDDPEVYEYVP
eukprot:TRINITY_DN55127_c0_g1_i1.p1 TRINITY_DN55127_c0_g1~~TRINITY_DN55127_c0_g1_i1.p1  ORF type:complete len:814 (+),score=235.12 TRINITY_DN55127_c0_g1_i1:123-2564(+)